MVTPSEWVWPGMGPAPLCAAGLGGKGRNLARLVEMGQPVPPFYVVTTDAFRAALEAVGLAPRIAARLGAVAAGSPEALRAAADEVRGWVQAMPLPPELAAAIERVHRERIPDDAFVAVRSSSTDEDATGQSFAGLHDSLLFVRGAEGRAEAIRRVWASVFNERALAYRREKGIPWTDIACAGVVQEMVHARVSGVMFTANPVTGGVHELVISALYGAGEGLVSAGLDADTFTVDKDTLAIAPTAARKAEQFVLNEASGGGLWRVPVPEPLRDAPCLADEAVRTVAHAGLAIERGFERPQDVEFSFDADGRLFILQARPVTTAEEYGPAAGHRLIWDNSNIIESYSGVTSPMTFSFIRRAYTIVYHCFAEVMGIPPRVVRANAATFENMLGLFRGRVYYNLLNWYRLVRLFPGFQYNRRFMESMMGLKEPAELAGDSPPPGFVRRYFVELPALVRLLLRSSWNFLRIRGVVARFEADFAHHYERWAAMDFRALPPHRLLTQYREMEDALLWNWKAPIINDFFVMIFYGTLKKLCTAWCGDAQGSLQNDLLCGEGGIESAEPARRLLALTRLANENPALRERILSNPPAALAREVPADPRFHAFSAALADYLALYGFRCMNELKLEEYSLRDRPEFLYQVIRNYLGLGNPAVLDGAAIEEREQRIRAEAERRADEALCRGGGLFPRRRVFRWVLHSARLGVKNRENMRFARTRIYGLLRELIRAAGGRLAAEGILDAPDDVFHLTLDEVWDFVKGTAVTTDLRGLAALRRREFDAYRREEDRAPDDRFETYGMAYHRNRFRNRRPTPATPADGVLRGIGCCPGTVTGTVKVLLNPADDMHLAGEILVAERTDPGWVPLYPSVSGLLIERGSILSHSAIVAREMGIPTIVGIPGLVAALRTGQRVSLDGAAGTVRILEEGPG